MKNIEKLKELKDNLKTLRQQNNFTQKYVASLLDIKYQAYQSYELGVNIPPLDKLIILAETYDVSLDFLVGRKEY